MRAFHMCIVVSKQAFPCSRAPMHPHTHTPTHPCSHPLVLARMINMRNRGSTEAGWSIACQRICHVKMHTCVGQAAQETQESCLQPACSDLIGNERCGLDSKLGARQIAHGINTKPQDPSKRMFHLQRATSESAHPGQKLGFAISIQHP